MRLTLRWAPLPIVIALAAVLAGCGSSSSSSSTTTSTRQVAVRTNKGCPHHAQAAGTVQYSDWEFPDTLNPFQTTSAASYETMNGMFDSLFIYNQKAQLQPMMAAEMPTAANGGIKDGGKTIVIHLKKGMKWSNGTEITSKDVLFGWQVEMDPATGPYCTGSCDQIARIDTPDRYTAVLHFKQVFAPALSTAMPIPWPHVWPGAWTTVHQAAVKLGQQGSFNFENASFPTDGPYQVTSFVRNDRISLQPMKYYSDMNCGPGVKNLIFSFYSDKPGMISAAASGNTDVTQDYTAADLPELQKHTNAYSVYNVPGFDIEHLEFNVDSTYNGKANPLANTNVRQALGLALDKMTLIESALGVSAAEAKQIIAWTPWVNTPKLVQPYADKSITGQWDPIAGKYVQPGTPKALADARALLAKTPWKTGFSLSLSTTSGNPTRAAQEAVIANSWRKIGVKVTPNYIPASKLFAGYTQAGPLNQGQFQVAMFAFTGSPEPDSFKYELASKYIDRNQSTHSAINENYSGIKDPSIDQAFSAASSTFDNGVRAKNYESIQERLAKQSYWISLYFRPQIATADSNVQNFSDNPTQLGPTWNVYAWKTARVA